jgi:hypothetical protein
LTKTNKELYEAFCKEHADLPLFLQKWWMDAVCIGKEWDVFLYEEKKKIRAVFVFHYVEKRGFKFILQPQLTQYNGVWIDYPSAVSAQEKRSLEKRIMYFFIDKLETEKYTYYEQNFHHSIVNWLPFYWKGFQQTTRYTCQINDLSDTDKCFANFAPSKQSQVRKTEKELIVDFDCPANEFYETLKEHLHLRGKKISYTQTLFMHLYHACVSRGQGKIIAVRNKDNQLYAALFLVWDATSAYLLITTMHPHYRSSGASSRMVMEAIKYVSDKVQTFDFEGSMDEAIEMSFSHFGTEQTPYFNIRKSNSLLFDMLLKIKKYYKSRYE